MTASGFRRSGFAERGAILFSRNRVTIALFVANVSVIGLAYIIYLVEPHYSCDTFAALSPQDLANVNRTNGRVVHSLLYSLIDAIGWDLPRHIRVTQMMLTVVCAFGTSVLTRRFFACLESRQAASLVLLDAGLLLVVVNPYFLSGWYYWPETCFGASAGMLVTFLAAIAWSSRRATFKNKAFSLALVVVAGCMYQVYLLFFFGIAVAYTLVAHSFKVSRRMIVDLAMAVAWCAIAGVVSMVAVSAFGAAGEASAAHSALGVSSLIDGLKYAWRVQGEVTLEMHGMLPPCFLLAVIGVFLVAGFVHLARTGSALRGRDVLVVLGCALAVYAVSFAPVLLSQKDPLPRLFAGLFTLPVLAAGFYAFAFQTSRMGRNVGSAFAVAALGISLICTIMVQIDTVTCNSRDDEQLDVMCAMLAEYEAESGNEVDTILYRCDSVSSAAVSGVHRVYDMNVRNMRVPWFFKWAILDRLGESGKSVTVAEMDAEARREMFPRENWDWFDPSEQIAFDGNTMYVLIY